METLSLPLGRTYPSLCINEMFPCTVAVLYLVHTIILYTHMCIGTCA